MVQVNIAVDCTRVAVQQRSFGAFRLVLALLVFVQHALARLAPAPLTQEWERLEVGSVAVLAFFALSGFVIVEAADTIYRARPLNFLINRGLRLWPLYGASLALAMLVWAITKGTDAFGIANIAANIVGIFPLSERAMTANFVEIAWALRVEMAFYAFVGLALAINVLRGRQASLTGALVLVAAATLPAYGLTLFGKGVAMFQYWPHFVFGGALYGVLSRGGGLAFALLLVAGAGIFHHVFAQAPLHPVVGYKRDLAGQALLLAGLLGTMGVLALLSLQHVPYLDKRLGDLTYPLYMMHMPVVDMMAWAIPARSVSVMVVALAASFVMAWLAQGALEPLVARLRNRVRGHSL